MKKLWIAVLALLLASAACAEDQKKESVVKKLIETALSPIETVLGQVTELQRIVVTPSRFEERLGASSCSISVIDDRDFEREEVSMAKDALKEEVGIDISQSGAFQGLTQLYMRGGSSNHTLIMIDGVKAYDPMSTNGSYNLAFLTLDNVERIEVLRGPQSALYGSDAMAGVVSIISKKAERPYVNAGFEAGSFYTYKEYFEAGAKTHGFSYSIAGSRDDSKGISQAQAKDNNQERDPYDRTAVAGRIDYEPNDKLSIGGTLRYTNAHYQFDGGWPFADDDDLRNRFDEFFATIYGTIKPIEWLEHSLRLGWMDTLRRDLNKDPGAPSFQRDKFSGKFFKLDLQNRVNMFEVDNLILGYEYTEEIGDSYYEDAWGVTDESKVFAREGDLYLENRINLYDRLTSTQGVRIGHHSRAGTFATYRVDGSYLFATGTKIRGLFGTGFKAPSLYQLNTPRIVAWWGTFGGGNPNLSAEKSVSYEYGADQYLFNEKLVASATYFHCIYKNLIDATYDPTTGNTTQYANTGKAPVHGIEFAVKASPIDILMTRFGFTYLKSKNLQTDGELLRRPEWKLFGECHWRVNKKLSMDLRVRYNGPMADVGNCKVKEYTVADFVVNYDLTNNISVYGKIENAFDQHYEEVTGYGTPPLGAYGGVKAKF